MFVREGTEDTIDIVIYTDDEDQVHLTHQVPPRREVWTATPEPATGVEEPSVESPPTGTEIRFVAVFPGRNTRPAAGAPVVEGPVLDGEGIEGECPDDLSKHLWEDRQKMGQTRKKLKDWFKKKHKDLDIVVTTWVTAMIHTSLARMLASGSSNTRKKTSTKQAYPSQSMVVSTPALSGMRILQHESISIFRPCVRRRFTSGHKISLIM